MKNLVMLEDDVDRIARFRAVLADKHPGAILDVTRTAPEFIQRYGVREAAADLICLDHDLFPDTPDEPDPGDGRYVAAFLASQPTVAPVLIHSTNADAADSMLFTLLDNGWTAERISPLGQDWIEAYWYPVVLRMVGPESENR